MKKGFSLVELLISLIVISCITAAFTPIITKKFSSGVFGGSSGSNGWSDECKDISTDCKLCFKDECVMCNLDCTIDGQYEDTPSCKCLPCTDKFGSNCTKCESDKCESCLDGSYLDNGNCVDCKSKFEHCTKCDKNECKTCETNYKLDNGKCVPDCTKFFNENCTTCDELSCKTCKPNYDLVGNDCIANCPIKFGENCITCSDTACTACSGNYILSNGSCTTCSAKFGSSCTACNSTKCTTCANGYHLSGSTCVADFSCSGSDFMQIGSLCVTRKNMGDGSTLPIPSGVTVANVNQTCNSSSSNKCCWKGATSGTDCNNNGGAYSGCNRTVCDWYAADYICKNFTAGGRTWRLPTKSEMSNWDTNSKGLGVNGLQLCDCWSGYSSAYCDLSNSCPGSSNEDCDPFYVWSGTVNGSSYAYFYYLTNGSWIQNDLRRTYAFSVRCVTEL